MRSQRSEAAPARGGPRACQAGRQRVAAAGGPRRRGARPGHPRWVRGLLCSGARGSPHRGRRHTMDGAALAAAAAAAADELAGESGFSRERDVSLSDFLSLLAGQPTHSGGGVALAHAVGGDSGNGAASAAMSLPDANGYRCLDAGHLPGCTRCQPPPASEEEQDYQLSGDKGDCQVPPRPPMRSHAAPPAYAAAPGWGRQPPGVIWDPSQQWGRACAVCFRDGGCGAAVAACAPRDEVE